MFVELREGESQENLLKRFRQVMTREGVLREIKRKRYFVSKSESRRRAMAKAVRRERKRSLNASLDRRNSA